MHLEEVSGILPVDFLYFFSISFSLEKHQGRLAQGYSSHNEAGRNICNDVSGPIQTSIFAVIGRLSTRFKFLLSKTTARGYFEN